MPKTKKKGKKRQSEKKRIQKKKIARKNRRTRIKRKRGGSSLNPTASAFTPRAEADTPAAEAQINRERAEKAVAEAEKMMVQLTNLSLNQIRVPDRVRDGVLDRGRGFKFFDLFDRVRKALRLAETKTGSRGILSRGIFLSQFQNYYMNAHDGEKLDPKKYGFDSLKHLINRIGLEVHQDNAGRPGTEFIEYGNWIDNLQENAEVLAEKLAEELAEKQAAEVAKSVAMSALEIE
jgi:hypothetical protein